MKGQGQYRDIKVIEGKKKNRGLCEAKAASALDSKATGAPYPTSTQPIQELTPRKQTMAARYFLLWT